MDTTQHDLKILSICYYIMAGICGTYVLFFGAYAAFFGAVIASIPMRNAAGTGIPEFVPRLVAVIGAAMLGIGLVYVAVMLGAAWSMPKRRNYPLVITAAVLNCVQIPFGTALGVFTFMVLGRQGVKESFYGGYQPMPGDYQGAPPPLPPV
jgi:hypothetical protein